MASSTIGDDGGRDYATPQAWEDTLIATLTEAEEGVIYNDSGGNQDSFTGFSMSNHNGTGTNTCTLKVNSGDEHELREDYGIKITSSSFNGINNNNPYTYFYDIIFEHTGSGGGSRSAMDTKAVYAKFVRCMGTSTATNLGYIFTVSGDNPSFINCVAFDPTEGGCFTVGYGASDNFTFLGCVATGATENGWLVYGNNSGGQMYNCIATNSTTSDFDIRTNTEADYIISDDTTHTDASFTPCTYDKQVSNANFESAVTATSPWNFQWQDVAAFTNNFQNYGEDQSATWSELTPSGELETRDFAGSVCDCGASELAVAAGANAPTGVLYGPLVGPLGGPI